MMTNEEMILELRRCAESFTGSGTFDMNMSDFLSTAADMLGKADAALKELSVFVPVERATDEEIKRIKIKGGMYFDLDEVMRLIERCAYERTKTIQECVKCTYKFDNFYGTKPDALAIRDAILNLLDEKA